MTFTFTYSAADLRELSRVVNLDAVKKGRGIRRSTMGWAIFLIAATGLVLGLKGRPTTKSENPLYLVSPENVMSIAISALPWGALVMILVLLFAAKKRAMVKLAGSQRTQIMHVESDAVSLINGPVSSRWEWIAFDKLIETRVGFFLRVGVAENQWVVLPRTAIPDPQTEAVVRAMFENNVGNKTSAFPVTPIPVDTGFHST